MIREGEDAQAGALRGAARELGLALDNGAVERLLAYLDLLSRWNRTYNLTALRDREQMLVQHLFDCLAVVPPLVRELGERAGSTRLLDVGSGGGLPGVVLAIMMPALQVTCVDAVAKKAAFVRQAAGELGLQNLRAVHARVEQLAERFDIVASRAFASLPDFCRMTEGALARGGVWMAMKGKMPEDEIRSLPPGLEVFHVEHLTVPSLVAERCLVWIRRGSA